MPFDTSKLSSEERLKLRADIATLKEKFALYTRKDDLRVGDLVFWKPGLTNRRFPRPGTAGIVTRVFPVPFRDKSKTEAGSSYFNEDLSVTVGVVDNDGDFIEFAYDAQRLQRVSPDAIPGRHIGFTCDACGDSDFSGVRFHCTECNDTDLCAKCQARGARPGSHTAAHKVLAVEPCTAALLRERLATLQNTACFQPGDLVQWKPGMKNKRRPKDDEFGIVVEMYPAPIADDRDQSASSFIEPLDVRVGIVDDDGDFIIYHFDSRRFTKAM